MGKGNKKGLFQQGLLILFGFAVGAASVLIFLNYRGDFKTRGADYARQAPPLAPPAATEEAAPVAPAPAPAPVPAPVPAHPKARIAIVIDDMGPDLGKLKELFDAGGPITIAIMPNQRHSAETAKEAAKKGWDVILHLPMEPKDIVDNDPGDGALLTGMDRGEIEAVLAKDLSSVPNAIGVNNHMGSKFTEDEEKMRVVLGMLKKRGAFFLDSKTSPDSVAGRLAREMGLRSAERSVFLDNTRDVEYVKGQIRELVGIASRKGFAIGIGHPYPETIEALRQTLPSLRASGVKMVRLSELVNGARKTP
ncbi:MAG: divergent polysaccharide deacetylase family protein [Deltaproteobacteria bacterium]|nr:divergent polysaccharide deacetylase family protein [Deltaproteobacteria bacterium]